jgi:branched-chain amino acid transport system permease protein
VSNFLDLLAGGLTTGAIYGIFAACLAVWFRVSNILNLAVGDFAMLGAVGVAQLAQNAHVSLVLSIFIDLVCVGAVAWVFDRFVLHFAFDKSDREHGITSIFFYTFGLSLVIEGIALAAFGTNLYAAPALWKGPALNVLSLFHIQRPGVLVLALAIVSGVALWSYLGYTVAGRAASACGESAVGSRIVGIRTSTFRRRVFVFTAMLAALFGIIVSPITGFVYNSGPTISLIGVLAAGFAGFHRPGRAVVIGLLLGVVEAFLGGYVSTQYNDVILYGLMFVIVLARPSLLGITATV